MPCDCPCRSLHADHDAPFGRIHRIGGPMDGSLARPLDTPGAPE